MISDAKRKVLQLFAEGRKLYKERDFRNALEKFQRASQLDPTDGPSEVFKNRCELYIKEPPPEGWNGVFEMKTK